jgi:acetyltransferase-like isoleucine patch superfamily enzyme
VLLIKIFFHIIAEIKKVYFKIIFGNRVHFGHGFTFRKGFNLFIEKKGKVEIGKDCFFNNSCSITCLNSICIGEGTIFGEGVRIYDHNHKFANFLCPIKEQGYSIGKIKIGKHCWVGSNVVILKGADIGDNCVIGAGCVISEKIEDGSMVKLANTNVIEPIREVKNV